MEFPSKASWNPTASLEIWWNIAFVEKMEEAVHQMLFHSHAYHPLADDFPLQALMVTNDKDLVNHKKNYLGNTDDLP